MISDHFSAQSFWASLCRLRRFSGAAFELSILLVGVLVLSSSTDLAAQGMGRLTGQVLAGQGQPAPDAVVTLTALGRRATVDGDGRFVFEDVPSGTHLIEVDSRRWGRLVDEAEVVANGSVEIVLNLQRFFHLDEVVVSAGPLTVRRSEAYQPTSVVTARDLVAKAEATLGETLAKEPGVTSTYFGPGASRPVIRGLGGDRVRVLEGGVGVGDASNTSPDHAVGIEPRMAERIEVVRGPATLLYGSSAVGGVVNVLDAKIARQLPTETLQGYAEGVGGTVSDERTTAASLTATLGRIVLHGSGLTRSTGDYSIPGFAESEQAHGDEGGPGEDPGEGVLTNSSLETQRVALGSTYVGERGYLGVAWSGFYSEYGVPGHGDDEHQDDVVGGGHNEEGVRIDLVQTKFDVEGLLRFDGRVSNLKGRLGYADYDHQEIENRLPGTLVANNFLEGRLESQHTFGERVSGAVGGQMSFRDLEVTGDESFVPQTDTRLLALFAFEDFRISEPLRVQIGARWESQSVTPATGQERNRSGISLSTALNWSANEWLGLSMSASRSVKLPTPEEMFSNGPHAATRAYELGNIDLGLEVAWGMDLSAHLHGEWIRGSASVFSTQFEDFVFQRATGDVEDGFPVLAYIQEDARYSGVEGQIEIDLLHHVRQNDEHHLAWDLLGDFVRARLTETNEDLPRIPPLRLGAGLSYAHGEWTGRTGIRRTGAQTRVGVLEDETAGFTLLDAVLSYRIFTGRALHDLTLVLNNLSNAEARLHTSFLKQLAPLPGREIRFVYRISF